MNCLLLSWSCKVWHSVKLVDGRGSQNYLNLIGPRYNTDFIIKVASLLLVFSPPLIIYSSQLQKADAASPATARILVSHSVPPLEQAMPVNSCCTTPQVQKARPGYHPLSSSSGGNLKGNVHPDQN